MKVGEDYGSILGFGVSVFDAADYATRKMAVLGVVNEAGLNIRGEVLLNGERIREALLAEDGWSLLISGFAY